MDNISRVRLSLVSTRIFGLCDWRHERKKRSVLLLFVAFIFTICKIVIWWPAKQRLWSVDTVQESGGSLLAKVQKHRVSFVLQISLITETKTQLWSSFNGLQVQIASTPYASASAMVHPVVNYLLFIHRNVLQRNKERQYLCNIFKLFPRSFTLLSVALLLFNAETQFDQSNRGLILQSICFNRNNKFTCGWSTLVLILSSCLNSSTHLEFTGPLLPIYLSPPLYFVVPNHYRWISINLINDVQTMAQLNYPKSSSILNQCSVGHISFSAEC